jgi:prepilin-type N-terminal cleavage/methylation domain-containing protein
MQKNSHGFTIVEITIAVVIIALLASISVVAYARIQADSRDTTRSSRVAIIADALEKYYLRNGEYPSCSAMTQSGSQVATTVLGGIDPTDLLVPGSPSGVTNSIICTALTATSPDAYAYIGDGSTACSSGQSCLKFSLQYRQETTDTVLSLGSTHSANISTIVAPTLVAATSGNTQINLSWNAIDNAIQYRYQRANDAAFTNGLVETDTTGTTASAIGLTPGMTYYFRVLAIASTSQGNWSNIASPTTSISPPTAAPTVSAGMVSTNAVGTSTAVSCSAGTPRYQFRSRSTTTATMGAWSSWSALSAMLTFSVAASQGYQYGFQAQAVCTGPNADSPATAVSNIPTTVRPIDTPVAPVYLSPGSFKSDVTAAVNFSSSCPAGTTLDSATFRSKAWTGSTWGPHPFGYIDDWTNSTGSNKNVEYWGKYRCLTTYSTSSISPESYTVIVVRP